MNNFKDTINVFMEINRKFDIKKTYVIDGIEIPING